MCRYTILAISILVLVHFNLFSAQPPESSLFSRAIDTEPGLSSLATSRAISFPDERGLSDDTTIPQAPLAREAQFPSFEAKKKEMDTIKKSMKVTGALTVATIATAGVLHCGQSNQTFTRGSLISAGDVLGVGGVAQGAGGIIKGIAAAIAG